MDIFSKLIYVSEIRRQCQFALDAFEQLNETLISRQQLQQRRRWDRLADSNRAVFRTVHSLLTHASNVSRIFWASSIRINPGESKDTYKIRKADQLTRARDLRADFGLSDHHILRERRLRDHLEHFDERLDDWRMNSVHHNVVDDYIGRVGVISGITKADTMRTLDPGMMVFSFRGEPFNLQQIATAIREILSSADRLQAELRDQLKQIPRVR
jgi:hypothetical protein